MLAGRRAIVLSHPSRKKRGLDGAQTIEGEPGVKYLTGPPATWGLRGVDSQVSDARPGSPGGKDGDTRGSLLVQGWGTCRWLILLKRKPRLTGW